MIRNISRHWNQSPQFKEKLWFPGTTRVRKGMGLCYDLDIADTGTGETATDPWGRRGNSIAVPSTSNNKAFAGVSSMNYPANANGQYITVNTPGSICQVAVGLATTINSTRLTCSVNSADAGRFTLQGLPGRGTALALETQAAATGGNITIASLDGSAVTSWSSPSLTITETGIGTACGYGDSAIDPTEFRVIVLGGSTTLDSTTAIATKGEYAVVTAPSADTITIATNIGTACAITLYVIKNTYPTVLCYLYDEDESGCQEIITPETGEANQNMVGGCTFLAGGITMAADSTSTLADGTHQGERKGFVCLGALTTQDWLLTVTSGLQIDGSTGLATLEIDAQHDVAVLEWNGGIGASTSGVWNEVVVVGPTIA